MMSCPNKSPNLLELMPSSAAEASAWFETLTDRAFDTVCVSAVTMLLTEEQDETGFVSATSIARCTRAVQGRYRKMAGIAVVPEAKTKRIYRSMNRGEASGRAKLNQMQVSLIRRVDGVPDKEFADMFGVATATIADARTGCTWQCVPTPPRKKAG